MKSLSFFALSILGLAFAFSEEPKAAPKPTSPEKPTAKITQHQVTIGEKSLTYEALVDKTILLDDEGKEKASIFHIAYLSKDQPDPKNRPVLFAFNGGPGSSSVWLHLSALGPKSLPIRDSGTSPFPIPCPLEDNPHTLLDVADIVFIDPVSTGYSRATDPKNSREFHGVNSDAASVADFIRRWITENQRWASPKFILGESYGGIRAVGVASELQEQYGMHLNGVILMSSLLDFRTISPSLGNDLSYEIYLPSFTALAHFHGKLKGDAASLIEKSRKFAKDSYSQALRKGRELSPEDALLIAKELSNLTSLSPEFFIQKNLRVDLNTFRAELLKEKSLVIGRFDGRVTAPNPDASESQAYFDPSYHYIHGPISTAMLDYLGRDLQWQEASPYKILNSRVHPWDWNASNSYLNLSEKLINCLTNNPNLKVLVMAGRCDLATPKEGIEHSIHHLIGLPNSSYQRIQWSDYDAGHMFYLNQKDRTKMRQDLLHFISSPRS